MSLPTYVSCGSALAKTLPSLRLGRETNESGIAAVSRKRDSPAYRTSPLVCFATGRRRLALQGGLVSTGLLKPRTLAERLPAIRTQEMRSETQVLLLIPNVVGYVRVALLLAAIAAAPRCLVLCWWCFLVNFALDGLDGALARRLGQTSSFGAFLDVIVDNVTRGVLWAWTLQGPISALPVILEMLAFVCTHRGGGSEWRTGYFSNAPWWVKEVIRNGFKSPCGFVAITGLMGCPLWLWARRFLPDTMYSSQYIGWMVVPGRVLAAAVELWIIKRHLQGLLKEDSNSTR
ncbi:hypothetical protein BSKO_07002 [Bryopsis sp. KO-2023]|nr:hypothetical protein BSKO_07002 [Bryopsis sp. KO-2023]